MQNQGKVIVPGYYLVKQLSNNSYLYHSDTDQTPHIAYICEPGLEQASIFKHVKEEISKRIDGNFVLNQTYCNHNSTKTSFRLVIIYPMCLGGSLKSVLAAGVKLDAREILYQLVACVGTMHLYGKICRYLAPSAVLFLKPNSREIRIDSCKVDLLKPKKVDCYIAPELMMEDKFAPTTSMADIWSIAAIVYEVLTKKPPYDSRDKDPSELFLDTSREPDYKGIEDRMLVELLKLMLQRDPNYRISLYELLRHPIIDQLNHHPNKHLPHLVSARDQLASLKKTIKASDVLFEPPHYLELVQQPIFVLDPPSEFKKRVQGDFGLFVQRYRELSAKAWDLTKQKPLADVQRVTLDCIWMIIFSYTFEWLGKITQKVGRRENIFNLSCFNMVVAHPSYEALHGLLEQLCQKLKGEANSRHSNLVNSWEAITQAEVNSPKKTLVSRVNEALNICGVAVKQATQAPTQTLSRAVVRKFLAYLCEDVNVRDEAMVALVVATDRAVVSRDLSDVHPDRILQCFLEIANHK